MDRDWQPSGQPAEQRSVAATVLLRQTASSDFRSLSGAWCVNFLQEGLLFRQKSTGRLFISLGAREYAALAWEVHEIRVS